MKQCDNADSGSSRRFSAPKVSPGSAVLNRELRESSLQPSRAPSPLPIQQFGLYHLQRERVKPWRVVHTAKTQNYTPCYRNTVRACILAQTEGTPRPATSKILTHPFSEYIFGVKLPLKPKLPIVLKLHLFDSTAY